MKHVETEAFTAESILRENNKTSFSFDYSMYYFHDAYRSVYNLKRCSH